MKGENNMNARNVSSPVSLFSKWKTGIVQKYYLDKSYHNSSSEQYQVETHGQISWESLLHSNLLNIPAIETFLCRSKFPITLFDRTGQGLLGKLLTRFDDRFFYILELIVKTQRIARINEFRGNAIHSLVAVKEFPKTIEICHFEKAIMILLDAGCELDQCSRNGTALSVALIYSNLTAANALLRLGADINQISSQIKHNLTHYRYKANYLPILAHLWKLIDFHLPVSFFADEFVKSELLACDHAYATSFKQTLLVEIEGMRAVKLTAYFSLLDFVLASESQLMSLPPPAVHAFFRDFQGIRARFGNSYDVLMVKYRQYLIFLTWQPAYKGLAGLLPAPEKAINKILKYLTLNDLICLAECDRISRMRPVISVGH